MTEENLKAAFAEVAEKEGLKNVARLFRAISYAELVHARNHLGIEGETYEVNEMYPAFKAVAGLQGEKQALTGIKYALEAEKIHATIYQDAKKVVEAKKDISIGYTVEGKAPDHCPICGAKKDKFKKF